LLGRSSRWTNAGPRPPPCSKTLRESVTVVHTYM
jgi:hypothetical protein